MTSQPKTKPNANSALSTWLYYLEGCHKSSIDLDVSRIKNVAQKLAVLHPAPYIITVAGTNGKGTTCRMLEAILIGSGYRVGVYSSPHLHKYNERVRINTHHPTDAQFVDAFDLIEQRRGDISLTYFEFATLAALLLFKDACLDIVILEVGLGGRLDATNIIDSNIAVITAIDIDHVQWLGNDRESIGREKAGIFRQDQQAVIGDPHIPLSVIDYAKTLNTQLNMVSPNDNANWSYRVTEKDWSFSCSKLCFDQLPLPHIPTANAATALATLIYSHLEFDETALRVALETAALPGRMQVINHSPMVILDVAHNPHAANYLNQQIHILKQKKDRKENGVLRIVVGMLLDKDISSTLKTFSADYWYCGTLDAPRGASADQLAQFLPENCTKTFASVFAAWQSAKQEAEKEDIILICGSFHTVANVIEGIEDE